MACSSCADNGTCLPLPHVLEAEMKTLNKWEDHDMKSRLLFLLAFLLTFAPITNAYAWKATAHAKFQASFRGGLDG